jgi:cobalt-zinc-cadmium efflux system protein
MNTPEQLPKKPAHTHVGHAHSAVSNIKVAFFLNLFFSAIELVGGLLTNSVAILSDALHDFGDSFSLALSWYFQKLSGKKRNAIYSYGYKRFSLLGALISSVVLLLGSLFVIQEAVERVLEPQQADAKGMLYLAIFGVVINGLAALRLKKGSSLNERAVGLHLLEDVLGWAAVLVSSLIMLFVDVPVLDPILSLAIAGFILFNIYKNLRDTLRVLLQGTPANVDHEAIETALRTLDGVTSIHDLHLWTMDGEYNILSVHLVVSHALSATDIIQLKGLAKERLKALHMQHATIEIDREGEDCACRCEGPLHNNQ